jgi:hypothetical protein
MTEVLKWVTAVLAIWGAVSILAAVFWALVGRKIFRPRPVQPSRLSETFVGDPLHWSDGSEVDPAELDAQVDRGER